MDAFMSALIKMSLRGVVIILVVLFVRLLLKRLQISHKYILGLWAMAFLYFIIPWKLSLSVGFWNNVHIPEEVRIITEPQSVANERYGEAQNAANVVIAPSITGTIVVGTPAAIINDTLGTVSAIPAEPAGQIIVEDSKIEENKPEKINVASVIGFIWLSGLSILFGHMLYSYFALKRKLRLSIIFEDNIWLAENIDIPMVFGLIRPRIYLPISMEFENLSYVIAHEKMHVKRNDGLIKMFVYVVCLLHWFNPFIWIAYFLFANDMEKACDEEVIRSMGKEKRKEYAYALLHIAAGNGSRKKRIFVAPIGFAEGNVKSRIRNVMKYRYTLPGIGAAVVIVILVLSAMFMTEAKESDAEENVKTEASEEEISGQNTIESVLPSLNAGVDEMHSLGAGAEDIPGLIEEKTDNSSDMAAVIGDIRERSDTTVLTVMKEGMPEEIPATLYVGEGYSFYLTDDDWVSYFPNEWIIGPTGHTYASFVIRSYAGLSKNRYEEFMTAKGYVKENGVLWWQLGDYVYGSILYETENDVWEFSFMYMKGEAEEGWASVIRAVADTFVVEAGYDVGEHAEKAVMPEGEHPQLYEDTYTDLSIRHWWAGDLEKSKGYYVYDELTILNITDTTFDFMVTWKNPETEETGTVIPFSTAYINEDMTSATYTGEDYTLTFDFSYIDNPLPEVLYIRMLGVDELEGYLFCNYNASGYEP